MKKSDATSLLKTKNLRCTPQRLELVEILLRLKQSQTAEALHKQLKGTCDLATVYRNLQQLEERGLLVKTFFSDQIARYHLAGEGAPAHHHHIECRKCLRLLPLDNCILGQQVQILEKMGFREITHRLEFQALCPQCA